MTFSEAIARVEGFGLDPNNRPTRNNNPGDIEWGKFAQSHGADRIEMNVALPRFAHFPTAEAGWACLRALLLSAYVGLTVAQAINRYAPPSENDTLNYVDLVCSWTGLEATTVLTAEML